MHELELIEPVNIDTFASVYISMSLSATLLLGGQHAITYNRWKSGRDFLINTIREKRTTKNAN
jgi:hypothetical protein